VGLPLGPGSDRAVGAGWCGKIRIRVPTSPRPTLPLTPPPPHPTKIKPGHLEKEVVAVNVQTPDYPPTHQVKFTVDLSNATFLGEPRAIKIEPKGDKGDTRVQMVQMPPIKVQQFPPIVTIDMRSNKSWADVVHLKKNYSQPDLQVVKYYLPNIPKLGHDVNISMGTIQVDRYNPIHVEGNGELKTHVTLVNGTLPSLNRIEALNKPFFKPGNITLATKGTAGKGAWGVQLKVEDIMSGGKGEAKPINVGAPMEKHSVMNIMKEAIASTIPGTDEYKKEGQFCSYKCCPACKPQPEKVEYAEPLFTCKAGCSLDQSAGKCVCAAAKVQACPAGKKVCEVAGISSGLCVEDSKFDKVCLAHGAVCLAQNKVATCDA